MKSNLDQLYLVLGYRFSQPALLETALRHRSMSRNNNERLEFLGDSILNFIIAAELYARWPSAKEGQLSRVRANLVKGETLAEIAQGLEIGNHLRLGSGELKSGGAMRHSILADALEAIIAAIYLDCCDMNRCRERVLAWYDDRLDELSLGEHHKDPKTRLQEFLQAKRCELPIYTITQVSGQPHAQIFHIRCEVPSISHATEGKGTSRRRAEQEAAAQFLNDMRHHDA